MNKVVNEIGYNKNVVMTEEIGEKYLSRRENERNATNRHIMAIAKSITNSGWFGSLISVSKSGELLDGQNRLLALRSLGWPRLNITLRVFDESEITSELRASFNKSRPQTLRDTMKMCFGWGVNGSRKVPVYSSLARICMGDKFVTDEYLMLNIEDTFPEKLTPLLTSKKPEPSCDIKCAFILAGLSDFEKSITLRDNLVGMIFSSSKCHARRIFDYLHSDSVKSNDSNHHKCLKGHGSSFVHVKRVLFAIDKYIRDESCPVLENVDMKKIDDVAVKYIELMKHIVSFK